MVKSKRKLLRGKGKRALEPDSHTKRTYSNKSAESTEEEDSSEDEEADSDEDTA